MEAELLGVGVKRYSELAGAENVVTNSDIDIGVGQLGSDDIDGLGSDVGESSHLRIKEST